MIRRIALMLLFLLMLGWAVAAAQSAQPDPNARFRGVPALELEGTTYRLNRHITTVLLMGIDQAETHSSTAYRSGGQADFLLLLAFNDTDQSISAIQINRDTMTTLTVLNVLGEETGTRMGQICLSHAFGDGGALSCEMTCDAVGALLNNMSIRYYIALSMDGIAVLNDALGGIEVTLEDDFTAFDPDMTAGRTLTLQGKQAEYYVRMRYSVGDQTNLSRQMRQRSYMNAALSALKQNVSADAGFLKTLYAQLEPYIQTNLSRGTIYNLGDKATHYSFLPIQELSGEAQLGESGFMEFYPDPDALKQLLAETLYEKAAN